MTCDTTKEYSLIPLTKAEARLRGTFFQMRAFQLSVSQAIGRTCLSNAPMNAPPKSTLGRESTENAHFNWTKRHKIVNRVGAEFGLGKKAAGVFSAKSNLTARDFTRDLYMIHGGVASGVATFLIRYRVSGYVQVAILLPNQFVCLFHCLTSR